MTSFLVHASFWTRKLARVRSSRKNCQINKDSKSSEQKSCETKIISFFANIQANRTCRRKRVRRAHDQLPGSLLPIWYDACLYNQCTGKNCERVVQIPRFPTCKHDTRLPQQILFDQNLQRYSVLIWTWKRNSNKLNQWKDLAWFTLGGLGGLQRAIVGQVCQEISQTCSKLLILLAFYKLCCKLATIFRRVIRTTWGKERSGGSNRRIHRTTRGCWKIFLPPSKQFVQCRTVKKLVLKIGGEGVRMPHFLFPWPRPCLRHPGWNLGIISCSKSGKSKIVFATCESSYCNC